MAAMKLSRRALVGGSLAAASIARAKSAGALVILDSTWRAEGGRPDHCATGFRAHIALARQPQFASLVCFSEDDGEEWDVASSTWVGNFGGVGWLLTAGHCFKPDEGADHYLYRTQGGTVHRGTARWIHPLYNGDTTNRGGLDVALVRLAAPVTDAGPPPLLWAGAIAVGTRVVIVGFGARGTGSIGEDEDCDLHSDNKTAAENTIDEATELEQPIPEDDDAGNWIRVTLRRETEGASRLDGILGGGDSGGSVWMRTASGWAVIAVNSSGTGDTTYGEYSYMARLAAVRPWLASKLPGLRFTT